ncbi:alcohol dehydrogenase catalytic domain-containing protein [Sinosporangium album]|nr:alcohol dehydrogenase catalytic domain-containing protein [Sinosporangium album]
MRAAFIKTLGPPENIRYGELPDPEPGPTDVLVDVTAVAVNPVDTFVRSGLFRTPIVFPFVVGRDLVGTVAATGPGAVGFAVGDAVWSNSLGHGGRQGAAAERVVVSADRLYHLPQGVDPVRAVAVAKDGLDRVASAYAGLITRTRDELGAFNGEELGVILRFLHTAQRTTVAEIDRLTPGPDDKADAGGAGVRKSVERRSAGR